MPRQVNSLSSSS